MNLVELLLTAMALSMDAFAVAICKGLAMKQVTFKNSATVGLYFGSFQALMPLLGYLLGYQFKGMIVAVDHWISFILLSVIGFAMIRESFNACCESCTEEDDSLSFRKMSVMAIATSIDALAIGVTFAFLEVSIIPAISIIGIITLIICMAGVYIGNQVGSRFKSKAELAGGGVLILIGLKILLEHTGILLN